MEDEVEIVPRALSTAKFLLAHPTTQAESKKKEVWDAATRKVITVTEASVKGHDVTAANQGFQRYLPWSSASTTETPDSLLDRTPSISSPSSSTTSPAARSHSKSSLAAMIWGSEPDLAAVTVSSPNSSSNRRSRRGSVLGNCIDSSENNTTRVSDSHTAADEGHKAQQSHSHRSHRASVDAAAASGNTTATSSMTATSPTHGKAQGRTRRSSLIQSEQHSGELPSSAGPAAAGAARDGQPQDSKSQPRVNSNRTRRASMTMLESAQHKQHPSHQHPAAAAGSASAQPRIISARPRRGSLPLSQDIEFRMAQFTASAATAAAAELPKEPDNCWHLALRPDRRSRSLDPDFLQQIPAAASTAVAARSASDAVTSLSKSADVAPGGFKSHGHAAASPALVGRRSVADVPAETGPANPPSPVTNGARVARLALGQLLDLPSGNLRYHKSKTSPLLSATEPTSSPANRKITRSKTGFAGDSSGGSNIESGPSGDGAESEEDSEKSMGQLTFRRYVPLINKIDQLAMQHGHEESESTAYDQWLDAHIAQGLGQIQAGSAKATV